MFANLQYILQHNCQIKLNKPVVIGVSGGPDSLCLLDLLWCLGYPVVVAHLNHRLRPSADTEAEFVQNEAENRQLDVICQAVNVLEYASDRKISIEEAARTLRYQFLFEQARLVGAQAVLVAHNADDQVETVLMHLLRGSGLSGLRGMVYRTIPNSWDANIPLVRPLLGYWREEIHSYLEERRIQAIQDESNQDIDFFRNRLRLELIPSLEGYNPRIKQAILRMAGILQGDNEIVEQAVVNAWDECCISTGLGFVGFNSDRLTKQVVGIQRGLFRRGIGVIRANTKDIDYDVIDRCLYFIREPKAGMVNLIGDISIRQEDNTIWLASDSVRLPAGEFPQLLESEEQWIKIPGICELQGGWVVSTEYVKLDKVPDLSVSENDDPFQAWVDAEKISSKILLRGRRTGDRFQPLGMSTGSMKISDFMINQKIPLRARDLYPLVFSGNEIVWVPGFQPGHRFRITSETQRIIHFYMMSGTSEP